MQHAASHTTAVQPSSHNQRHVLIGKQWYQLPELIPTNSNSLCNKYTVFSTLGLGSVLAQWYHGLLVSL